MAEEIGFENGRNSNFQGLVTTLTLDPAIRHTVVHHSSTSTYIPNFIEIEETFCGRTDVRTDISPSNIIRSTFGSRPNNAYPNSKFHLRNFGRKPYVEECRRAIFTENCATNSGRWLLPRQVAHINGGLGCSSRPRRWLINASNRRSSSTGDSTVMQARIVYHSDVVRRRRGSLPNARSLRKSDSRPRTHVIVSRTLVLLRYHFLHISIRYRYDIYKISRYRYRY